MIKLFFAITLCITFISSAQEQPNEAICSNDI